VLRQAGLASEIQIRRVQERVLQGAGSFIEVLVRDELVPEEAIADACTEHLKVPRARVATFLADTEALGKVPERLARKHFSLPLAVEGRVLVMAMADPTDYRAIQDLEFASALAVKPMAAAFSEVQQGIEERYGAEDRIGSFLANVPDASDIQIVSEDQSAMSVDMASQAESTEATPVVKMCNLVISDALKGAASDVHIEPALHDLQVRMRVDGVLRDYARVPKWLHGPVVSRLKILAKLDIAERRLPQDGRVNVQYQGSSVDLRVSTLPTHFGEKMVLRVLGGAKAPSIGSLGLPATHQRQLEASIQQPQGMILVTGPTGSGKTTSLYALLAWHHKPEINIVTVEDPIEFQLAGINQVQVNPKAGLTFASALRSILRQDPDVILVGEMRDRETVEIACQAAMTGHMVLSTLHTNSAVGAVTRMLDLGVDSAVLATSLTLVIAQRLVRRICNECREEYEPGEAIRQRAGLFDDRVPVYRGRGCAACGGTGFSGRLGIYEFFKPTNAIKKLINHRASEADMRMAARQAGMVPLREDAILKIKAGITSPDEVLRVVQADENEVACPACKALIETDFATCPYCRKNLKANCRSCGQALRLEWALCPYCNTPTHDEPKAEAPRPVNVQVAVSMPEPKAPMEVAAAFASEPPPEPAVPAEPVPVLGSFFVESGARKGAPPTPPARAEGTPAPVPAAVETDPEAGRRALRVLVVDDDADIRMVVSATLRTLEVPVEVVQAENGLDALDKVKAAAPDLVVLDVMMPRMDGFETCRALRENVRTAFVPILMLTASADQDSRTKGYLIGTDDYMSKPFMPIDLKMRIGRLLRRTYGI
jgi:type IV pilus assembly protein PilB